MLLVGFVSGGCTERIVLPVRGGSDAAMTDAGSGGAPAATGGSSGSDGRTGTGGAGGVRLDAGVPDGSATDGGSDRTGGTCTSRSPVGFIVKHSDVVFVVGRNDSMTSRFGDTTRMLAVGSAVRAQVASRHGGTHFGYKEFPAIDGPCPPGLSCCAGLRGVFPTPDSYAGIDQALRRCELNTPPVPGCVASSSARPLAHALQRTRELYENFDQDVPDRYVVVTIDGAPGCAGEDPAAACNAAQLEVSRLASAGIRTFILAIGDAAAASSCLDDLALAGGVSRPGGPPFAYVAHDPGSLAAALGDIMEIAATPSCLIDLRFVPTDPTLVSLFLRGVEVPFDPTGRDGWRFRPGSKTQIQVSGPSCRDIQRTDERDIAVWFGCPPCGVLTPCR